MDDYDEGEDERDPHHADDPALPDAQTYLSETFFANDTKRVYYQRQLQVLAEAKFFHWITPYALEALVQDGAVGTETEAFRGGQIRYYWPRAYRDRRRATKELRQFVARMSDEAFALGVGRHGETLVDAGLPRIGMLPRARKVREWNGRIWEDSGHDLDRVFELDGVAYGVEIKNQLQYIDQDEFAIKLKMCEFLGLKPLFIMRMLPKSYAYEVITQGGYAMILKYQLYPHGQEAFAKEVRERLGLPVDSPPALLDGTLAKFLTWHKAQRKRADS